MIQKDNIKQVARWIKMNYCKIESEKNTYKRH